MNEAQKKAIQSIDDYFKSGNSVPVSRATIKREEWERAKAALVSQAKSVPDYASMVVMEFNGERVPQFSQGYQPHELLEVVTAERCQQLVKLIDAPLASDERVRELIASDHYASGFQSISQYRNGLLKSIASMSDKES